MKTQRDVIKAQAEVQKAKIDAEGKLGMQHQQHAHEVGLESHKAQLNNKEQALVNQIQELGQHVMALEQRVGGQAPQQPGPVAPRQQ